MNMVINGFINQCILVFIAYLTYCVITKSWRALYTYVIGPSIYEFDFKSKGRWALVTGCTDGIGKEYAKQLAAKGCDVILVSRSLDKLKVTAEEIEKEHKVKTKTIQVDFNDDNHIYEHIAKEITDLEIGTLVNNVGVFYSNFHSYPDYFLDVPNWETVMDSLVKVNIVSMIKMNGLVLPGMVKRGRGVIINIGSASALVPSPLLAVYAATKSFVDKFSDTLEMEYSKRGIIVQTVNPSYVISNMTAHLDGKSSLFAPTAKDFVRSALSTVGIVSNTTGYFAHDITIGAANCMKTISKTFTTWLVTRVMETNRDKVKKKYKKF